MDETYRYYVVYEVYGNWNSRAVIVEINVPIASEAGITHARDEIQRLKKETGITITNWKRLD